MREIARVEAPIRGQYNLENLRTLMQTAEPDAVSINVNEKVVDGLQAVALFYDEATSTAEGSLVDAVEVHDPTPTPPPETAITIDDLVQALQDDVLTTAQQTKLQKAIDKIRNKERP